MKNLKFNKSMVDSIDEFIMKLTPNQSVEVESRYNLISKVAESYGVGVDTVTFYKNPYLFTLSDKIDNKLVTAKVESNKCLFKIVDHSNGKEDNCLINFTTKRFLKIS